MNRRKFIKGAGFLGFLAFLQACRLSNLLERATPVAPVADQIPITPLANSPIPTVTASPTSPPPPLPTVAPTQLPPAATATATPTGVAPVSPLASPTATPTPTPTPTPYPPGPPSKLGLFMTRYETRVIEMIAAGKPAIVKTLELDPNLIRDLKASSPATIMVGRMRLDQQNLDIEQGSLIQGFVEKLLPLAGEPRRMEGFDAWEAYNEPVADTEDKMKRLAEFEAERTRLLAENGIRSVVGNFAAGNPPLELWPHFAPALDAIRQYNGYLGLHEYSAPVMQFRAGAMQFPGEPDQGDEGWLTLRYRKVYRNFLEPMGYGDLPLLITECGVDGLVQPRPGPEEARGWQDFVETWLEEGARNDPPGVYMDQLIWYDENIRQEDYVKGAAIFLAGHSDEQWESYDILGPGAGRMADLLQQYLTVHPPV